LAAALETLIAAVRSAFALALYRWQENFFFDDPSAP